MAGGGGKGGKGGGGGPGGGGGSSGGGRSSTRGRTSNRRADLRQLAIDTGTASFIPSYRRGGYRI